MAANDSEVAFGKETFVFHSAGKLTDFYTKTDSLGSGSFGKVYRVVNKTTNVTRACKELPKSKISDIDKFKLEITLMTKIDHPYVIKLYETFEDRHSIYLIMDDCRGGELFDRIIENTEKGNPFTEKRAATIFKQLMSGISYCHGQGICHRDLKPENILFLSKDEDSPIKLIDFGLSSYFRDTKTHKKTDMTTKAGTAYYISPEVLNGNYDESCDIWSAGVILYIILCGYPPFNGDTDTEIYKDILSKKFYYPPEEWDSVSDDAKDLINKMLTDPDKRLNAQQVLEHKWVKENAPNAVDSLKKFNINSFKKYSKLNKFKKACLTFIASRLKDSEISHLKEIFISLDKNQDGTLTLDELKEGIEKMGQEIKGIEEIFKNIDTDNSGKIDYTEFIASTIDKQIYLKEDRLKEAFQVLDKDNSGKITTDEIKSALKLDDMSDDTFNAYIKECDKNGDGMIDYYEFLEMMQKMAV